MTTDSESPNTGNTAPAKLSVVFAAPFNIYPVTNGGSLRGYSLLKELTKRFNVEAIVPASAEEIRESILSELGDHGNSLNVRAVKAPREIGLLRRLWNKALTIRLSRTFSLSSNSMAIATCKALKDIFKETSVDAVILTTHDLAVCGSLVKKQMPGAIRIMDMHNVDHVLLGQELESNGREAEKDLQYQKLRRNESSLFHYSDGIFACSQHDLDHLKSINKSDAWHGAVIRNGVDFGSVPYDASPSKSHSKTLLFCGTLAYLPNIDGLNWFHSRIWPMVISRHPDARLVVVGRDLNPECFPTLMGDESIDMIGEVDSLQPYYLQTGVAICPLRMGSGTRFKIVEAMAYGNPVVSTAIGCQGLGAIDDKHLLIRDQEDEFATGVCELLDHAHKFDGLRESARKFVQQQYSWEDIGTQMSNSLAQWVSQKRGKGVFADSK